jgi:hypothetical protein
VTLVISTIVGAVVILGIWVGILYLFAKADKPHLEKDQIDRVFGDGLSQMTVKDSENG